MHIVTRRVKSIICPQWVHTIKHVMAMHIRTHMHMGVDMEIMCTFMRMHTQHVRVHIPHTLGAWIYERAKRALERILYPLPRPCPSPACCGNS